MPRLTPQQEAQIPFYVYKWRDISYSTEPIDREKVVEVINRAYSLIDKQCPPIAFCASPFEYIQKVSVYWKNIEPANYEKLIDHLNQFHLRQELKERLPEFELPEDLGEGLNNKLHYSNELFFIFHKNIDNELNDNIYEVFNNVCKFNPWNLRNLIHSAISPFIETSAPRLIYNSISASSSANNYRWFDVRITLLGAECDRERWENSVDVLQNCGTVYPFEKICFVCDRPTKLLFDENGFIHALGEPAIAYADGFQIFAYHGKLVSGRYTAIPLSQWESQWYEDEPDSRLKQALIEVLPPEQLKSEWFLEEENAILQQNLLNKIGYTRILNELKIADDLNILSQAFENSSSSGLRVAWAILQNRTEPKIQSVIEKWRVTGGGFSELRKMIMLDSLDRILDWYKSNVPNYIDDFLPGLTYEEIADPVKDLPFKLPQEVYDLYQWRNGSNYESGPIFIYHYFSSFKAALENNESFNYPEAVDRRIQDLYPPYLFPVFEFNRDEYFAVEGSLDQADTALVFIMGLGGGEEKLVFNSLTTMIIAIAKSYEAGVYKYDPDRHDMDWEDMEKSRQIRLKYNIGTTNKLFSVDGG